MTDEQIERLISGIKLLAEKTESYIDALANKTEEIIRQRMETALQQHATWINKVMGEKSNETQLLLRENQEWYKSYVKRELEDWREGERQKIQLRQIRAQESIAETLAREADLHEEAHRDLNDGDEWKKKR